jgi:hypothetical protein
MHPNRSRPLPEVARRLALGLLIAMPTLGFLALGDSPPLRSFAFALETHVPLGPEEAWDAFTGDVRPWWDHHFSAQPARLFIDRFPGGGFYEHFDAEGNGVQHALVTWAERGKRLVLRGPFGLHGNAVDMVASLSFEADGDGTKVSLSVASCGALQEDVGAVVEEVWRHFLLERYTPHAAGELDEGR